MAETEIDMINRHVANGERLISEQEARIADMLERGQPTGEALALLDLLISTQKLHIEHLERYRLEHPSK